MIAFNVSNVLPRYYISSLLVGHHKKILMLAGVLKLSENFSLPAPAPGITVSNLKLKWIHDFIDLNPISEAGQECPAQ